MPSRAVFKTLCKEGGGGAWAQAKGGLEGLKPF